MVEGVRRGRIMAFERRGDVPGRRRRARRRSQPADPESSRTTWARCSALFEQYAKLSHHLAFEGLAASLKIDDPERFADTLVGPPRRRRRPRSRRSSRPSLRYERLQKLQDLLEIEIEKVNIDRRINNKVKKQMEKAQKEYYLNEKIKAIHQELGRKDDRTDEVEELKKKIETCGHAEGGPARRPTQELRRLEAMPPVSAEATVSRNYIDWLVGVPWKKASRESKDMTRAEKILNEDHYGLEKVKERILEFLAVRQLVQKTKGSIICFVGPPGVGKTSLAKSIARSLNRKFVRLSLGGVRDEAEIRGHRRTYIGAFPGQIIQMMKKAGTVNPVFLLDEVDKMSIGLPRRPVVGAPRGARPRAEPHVRRPLPRRRVRPLEGHVHRDGQHRRPDPAGPEGPDGASSTSPATRPTRRSRSPGSSSCRSSARPTG